MKEAITEIRADISIDKILNKKKWKLAFIDTATVVALEDVWNASEEIESYLASLFPADSFIHFIKLTELTDLVSYNLFQTNAKAVKSVFNTYLGGYILIVSRI